MTHRDLLLLSLLAASICPSSTVAQSSARSSCRGAEREDYFRAWEGRWVVRDSRGTLAGHNTVSISLDECVLREHYATPSGFESEVEHSAMRARPSFVRGIRSMLSPMSSVHRPGRTGGGPGGMPPVVFGMDGALP